MVVRSSNIEVELSASPSGSEEDDGDKVQVEKYHLHRR